MKRLLLAMLTTLSLNAGAAPAEDPYLWLEEVTGERALAWVRERNAEAEKYFAADPAFVPLRENIRTILDSRERIPMLSRLGDRYYNFWKDAANPRGLWRRTTLDEYRKPQPAWEIVLDVDALAKAENENWIFKGAECLRPEKPGEPYRRCMLSLSRGGADAVVMREFDLPGKAFVANGFTLPEAKQDIGWQDVDTLWVGTDFGPGSMTSSGYPRIVKSWKRGTPLADALMVYEGKETDVWISAFSERESGTRRDWVRRGIAFWNDEIYLQRDGKLIRLDIPNDANAVYFQRWLLVTTRTPWAVGGKTWPGGALLVIDFEAFVRGERNFEMLYAPSKRSTLEATTTVRDAILVTGLDNVRARLWTLRYDGKRWQRTRVPTPENAQVGIGGTYWDSNEYFTTLQDFTTPTTLQLRSVESPKVESLKSLPRFFNAEGIVTSQLEATSKDGTKIPYFIAQRAGTPLDGGNPTLIYGYGGFQSTELPWYSGAFGKGWLEPGGVFVLANLRGGGEFGPDWHRAAQKENKQRTWDDMAAVAEDLIARQITSPKRLGILGGSQGGLLTMTSMVQRPELFGGVVSQVPLIDMLRYHKLLAGASWIAEYGDPDKPEERAYIEKYSPYQNVKKDAKYPPAFIYTSTRDDRVHPGHARKMVARMREQGHEVLYFENIEGGHGAAANNEQSARMWAQTFTHLWGKLKP